MKWTFTLCVFLGQVFHTTTFAQTRQTSVSDVYQAVEKRLNNGDAESAFSELKMSAGQQLNRNDSLLYLKIRILEKLYPKSNNYTADFDTSLQLFFNRVNRYSFPEILYTEVVGIQSGFQTFKDEDRRFFDSVNSIKIAPEVARLTLLNNRLQQYLTLTPNSYYYQQLSIKQSTINSLQIKLINDSTNREILSKVGKSNVFNIGVSAASSQAPFAGLSGYKDAYTFFNGSTSATLGVKYSLNASLAGVLFNLYTGTRVKAGIVWNLFDAEYTVFDWANDTLIKNSSGNRIRELKSLKAGTRIGPMLTVLLTRNIAISAYYQARPGVMFLIDKYSFNIPSTNIIDQYEVTPRLQNYNLSNEVGLRIYFFKRLFINPFVHFGHFNWQNEVNSLSTSSIWRANHSFTFTGIRLGI